MGHKPGKEAFVAAVSWDSGMGVVLDARGRRLIQALHNSDATAVPSLDRHNHPKGALIIFEVDEIRCREGEDDFSAGVWRELTSEEWRLAREGDLATILTQLCPAKRDEMEEYPCLGVLPHLFAGGVLDDFLSQLPGHGEIH